MKNKLEKIKREATIKSENPTDNKKGTHWIIRIGLLIIIVLSLSLYFFYNNAAKYKGQVESLIVPTISEVSGKIIESEISLGQSVRKGDILAVIDNSNQTYEITQLELSLQKKKIALGDVSISQSGQASNAYLSARANYDSASIAADKASNDYANARNLYAEGAISNSDLEKAQVSAASASSMKSAALAQLNNTLSKTGQNASQIDVAILENQISQAKDNLAKYTLSAPCDGTIISKNYSAGSVVAPGYNIADIGSAAEMYVVFYVPETRVSKINYSDTIKIESNGKTVSGKVSYIDVKSQYTPKDLQTAANKSKTSFKVKARIPDDSNLKPGVDVLITLR